MAKKEATLLLRVKSVGANALGKLREGLGQLGKMAGVAAVALVGFAAKAVSAFRVQEKAINSLNQSLVQQGMFSKDLSKKYQTMASELQKVTTFGDEAIISSQALLQSFVGQNEITKDLTKSILDFATAQGVDLKVAAGLIGKTVSSSTNALARYGIEIDVTATKQEKMAQITEALNEKFGGQSEAAADGLGALEQMKNSMGDLMEVIGKQLAPLIIAIANRIRIWTEDLQNNKGMIHSLISVIRFLGNTAAGLKAIFMGVGRVIGTVFAGAIGAISEAMQGNFKKAHQMAVMAGEEARKNIGETWGELKDDISMIQEKTLEKTQANLMKEEQLEIASLDRKRQIREEAEIARQEQDALNAETRLAAKTTELENEIALIGANDAQKNALAIKAAEAEFKKATTHKAKMAALDTKDKLLQQQKEMKLTEIKKAEQKKREADQASTLSTIAGMQNSSNKTLASIGKAAALTQIAIAAPQGVAKALAAFPPPVNFAAAALVGAAFAAQAAQVAGIPLAEGGIVSAKAGGTSAIIGEGGRDEAVIPLDSNEAAGRLGGPTININGAILGDESQARQFAIIIDEQLLELRRGNESVSFDEDVV